ncbi:MULTISPECIES: hypothetical protein [Streptomyces]|uniref:hypothetical protein n=1 Tax=Streptomyces TaxID=1883 RepID=UPI001C2F0978|nr:MULTISPECIES: hypothetical protein [Streptomyces]MBV1946940.1 hypothetical protein [Streptomyces sp. BV129]BDH05958.1 hypothetical protein HEK131_31850 [Streptomyces seoulensis]
MKVERAVREAERTVWTGRRVLVAQAAVLAGLTVLLLVKEVPGMIREIKIYRMTGGLRTARRHP